MTKCGGCKKYIARADIAKCAKCAKCGTVYHPFCLKGGEEGTPNWVCPGCVSGNPPAPNIDVPVAEGIDSLSCLNRSCPTAATTPLRMTRRKSSKWSSAGDPPRNGSAPWTRGGRAGEAVMEGTGSRLESVIAELRLELNEKDQELLGNDVEVSNLPEENGENATHMIMAVATKLGVTLRESDIVSAERVGARRRRRARGGTRARGRRAGRGRWWCASRGAPSRTSSRPRPACAAGHLGRPQPVLSAAPLLRQREAHQVQPPTVLPNAEVGRRLSWRFL
ncbi:unnamed protein product [Plutella xylostella]|uniref:(diamondback moth) hypothetical protein n=1 Tax=Plutella xylostella TaxID=51655 RepID=A0A8S4GBJ0_PLUXY|nr:unnamed protein product [Plutella xylostella]